MFKENDLVWVEHHGQKYVVKIVSACAQVNQENDYLCQPLLKTVNLCCNESGCNGSGWYWESELKAL